MALYHFLGHYYFDSDSGEVRREGKVVRLEPQPAALLALLASRPGEVVSHDEIRHTIWGDGRHVNFRDSVHYCARQVRAALGDRASQSQVVETIPRRGYRLRADALIAGQPAEARAEPAALPEARRPITWRFAVAGIAAAMAISAPFVERRPNNHHQIAVAALKTVHDLVF